MKHKKEPKGDMMNSRNDPWWLRLHATWLLLLIAAVGWVGAPAGAQAQTISIVSGNNQTGTVGTPLANLLVVRVRNSAGSVVSGVTVNFAITLSNGSVSPVSAVTNSLGQASTRLT